MEQSDKRIPTMERNLCSCIQLKFYKVFNHSYYLQTNNFTILTLRLFNLFSIKLYKISGYLLKPSFIQKLFSNFT